jgi:hypothetical protein
MWLRQIYLLVFPFFLKSLFGQIEISAYVSSSPKDTPVVKLPNSKTQLLVSTLGVFFDQ